MSKIWSCRRTFIAVLAILCLTGLGIFNAVTVAPSIATVALAVAGANAAQGIMSKNKHLDK